MKCKICNHEFTRPAQVLRLNDKRFYVCQDCYQKPVEVLDFTLRTLVDMALNEKVVG